MTEERREKIIVRTEYVATFDTAVVLPEGIAENDVESISVKWGRAYMSLKDGGEISVDLHEDFQSFGANAKRPDECSVMSVKEHIEDMGFDNVELLPAADANNGDITDLPKP